MLFFDVGHFGFAHYFNCSVDFKEMVMKKLLITLCFLTTSALAADWTPYLKSLQDSCIFNDNFMDMLSKNKKLPKALQADVVKHTLKNNGYGNDAFLTLKNATAFGFPLKKISLEASPRLHLTLQFESVNPATLLPKFYLQQGNQKIIAGVRAKNALLITQKYNESTGSYTTANIKTITVPKNDKHSIQILSTISDNAYIAFSSADGWEKTGLEDGGFLKFDSKKKTLTCGGF